MQRSAVKIIFAEIRKHLDFLHSETSVECGMSVSFRLHELSVLLRKLLRRPAPV